MIAVLLALVSGALILLGVHEQIYSIAMVGWIGAFGAGYCCGWTVGCAHE